MADIHILDGTGGGNSWTVVAHLDVPDTNNAVGVNYRTALVNSGRGGTTVLPDGDGTLGTINSTEKTNITAGAVFEFTFTWEIERGGTTTAQLRSELRLEYSRRASLFTAQLQEDLKYFGHTESRA